LQWPSLRSLARGTGAFAQVAVAATAVCLATVGLALADDAGAAVRKPTNIAAQELGPALNQLAQSRGLQVLYLSSTVRDMRTHGASGDITTDEAFQQLLSGTGLTFRYLDARTVTVVPVPAPSSSDGADVSLQPPLLGGIVDPAAAEVPHVSVPRNLFGQAPPPASEAPTSDAANQPLQEIIVTGSRIAAPNEVSTSPIAVLTSKYIEASGKSDISDLITQLPQNFNNSLGQDLGNGSSGLTTAGGVATADLRGLGPNRTLVLVDGRRLGQGSPYTFIQQPAPDLDQIPVGLVERIEVVTGGASAAYGSDAIAGVINFILKKDFQGMQVDAQLDTNWHDNRDEDVQNLVRQSGGTPATGSTFDGHQRSFDVLMGTNFADNTGNVTGYLSYRHADPVASSQRDFGGCKLGPTTNAAGNIDGVTCTGSANSNWVEPLTGPNANAIYSVSGTGFVVQGNGVATTPTASFNSQPYIYMTREDDRYNGAVLAHQTLADYAQPYAEFYFMDDQTHQQVAPAAIFRDGNPLDPFGTNNYPVNCDNPLLSAQEAATLCSPAQLAYVAANPGQACIYLTAASKVTSPNCADVRIGRRNIEGGGRDSDYEHENYRAVFGQKGDFADAWSYDAYGQYYYTTFFNSNSKYLNFESIDNALQVTGTAAKPVCISGGPCVPYNIWSDGGVTPAQLNYLYLTGTGEGTSTLRTLHAEVVGQLGKYGITSPWARDGVGMDVGFEHRSDHEYFQPDAAEQSGLLSGFGSAAVPLDDSISVSEEFAEVRAPLLQSVPGAKELLFDAGYRRSDYSIAGTTNAYKFEVQYAPSTDYRVRVSYDKAIRAPSVVELFNPQLVGQAELGNDPCAPTFNANGSLAAPAVYTLAQCMNMRVTATEYGNGGTTNKIPQGTAGQLSELAGGNKNLKPEQAETYTVGVNFSPSEIPGLNGSVDYYHIAISGEVDTIAPSVILSNCADTANPFYCSQVVRSPVTGGLTGADIASGGYIVQTDVNIGAALASGIDAQLGYRYPLERLGDLEFELNGTYEQHNETTPQPGAHTYDCAGYFGFTCQTINPRWHHIARLTWVMPWEVSASLTWRFIGPVSQDNNSPDPTLHFSTSNNVTGTVGYDFFNARIPAYNYFDVEASWHITRVVSVRAGINNVLDKDPPVIDSLIVAGGQANTYDIYDLFGRQLFVAVSAKF
jgi:iron complex outermembrane recepter protein